MMRMTRSGERATLWKSGVWGVCGDAWAVVEKHSYCSAAAVEEGNTQDNTKRRRWDTYERRREFLLEVGRRLGAEGPGWARVRTAQVRALGGGGLLRRYNGSLAAAVRELLPEQECQGLLAPRKPHGYWRETGRARAFLEQLAEEKGVRCAADWASITTEDVRKAGGSALLRQYSYSLSALLVNELPELRSAEALLRPRRRWHRWECPEERRKFLEDLAARRGLRTPADWRRVTVEEVRREGGAGLLAASGGLAQALQEAFPHGGFSQRSCRARVSPRHWDRPANRRSFLEEVARVHGVEKAEDWRHVRSEDIEAMGGKALLRRYASSYDLLRDNFPDVASLAAKQCRPGTPVGYWRDEDNIRAFVAEVGRRYNVSCQEDWYRISMRQLKEVANPFGSLRWVDALRIAFPDSTWDEDKVSAKSKRTNQRHLLHTVAAIFPHSSIRQTSAPIA